MSMALPRCWKAVAWLAWAIPRSISRSTSEAPEVHKKSNMTQLLMWISMISQWSMWIDFDFWQLLPFRHNSVWIEKSSLHQFASPFINVIDSLTMAMTIPLISLDISMLSMPFYFMIIQLMWQFVLNWVWWKRDQDWLNNDLCLNVNKVKGRKRMILWILWDDLW